MRPSYLFIFSILFSSLSFAQGAHRIGQILVKGNNIAANVAPYASVQVCVAGTGCKTLANIYGDAALTSPLSNPLAANGSGNYDYYIASGCVDEQVSSPGQGAIFIPNVCPFSGQSGGTAGNPAAPAYAVQIANSSVNAFAADPKININPATHALTSQIDNGAMNSDSFGSVATAQASSTCTTTNCQIVTPPTSTDTTTFGALPETAGNPSSFWMDYRADGIGIAATNPLPGTITGNQYQTRETGSVAYTEPNLGFYQGAEQLSHYEHDYFLTPGYSNGFVGCPDYCPAKGYIQDPNGNIEGANGGTTGATIPTFNATTGLTTTDNSVTWTNYGPGTTPGRWTAHQSIAAGSWSDSYYQDVVANYNTAGIKGKGQDTHRCYGVGDCQAGGYNYPVCEGGFSAPSDEGCYMGPAFSGSTAQDWQGTLATVTDANHIIATPTASNGSQGDLRYLIDITSQINGTDDQPLAGLVDVVTPPGTGYGTVVMNSANMPISYAQGTLAKDCVVPVQNGTVAQATCSITVTSGTFDTASPVCMANTLNNTYAFGAQPISVSTAGGVATIATQINKSVGVGGYVFQGGMCGSMIVLANDTNAFAGGTVYGSAFMIIGSTDAHTAVYANYYASQAWAAIPNPGSQFLSKAVGGVTLLNLTRTGNVVTGTVSTLNQGHPPVADEINGSRYFTLAGCADATMNGGGDRGALTLLANGTIQVTYNQTGANSTCSNATFYPQASTAYFYWGTQVFDVVDHTLGLTAQASLNGHFLTSYQPHFVVGHKLDMPPHYSMSVEGIHESLNMAEPAQNNNGIDVFLTGVSTLSGNGHTMTSQQMRGTSGTGMPGNAFAGYGYFNNGLYLTYAPIHNGTAVYIGGLGPNYGGNQYFHSYHVLGINNNSADLDYNGATNILTWNLFGQSTVAPLVIAPTGITTSQIIAKTLQLEGTNPIGNITAPVTQFADCGRANSLNQPATTL